MKPPRKLSIETQLIHSGEPLPRIGHAVTLPIFQTSTFEYSGEFEGEAAYHDIKYLRLNNTPNHVALHAKLAALEGAEAAVVAGSGMAAISTALLAVLSAGDHFLIQSSLYGGTHNLLSDDLPALGITYDFIDPDRPETWEALLKPTTRAIYIETMSNPCLLVPDLEAVASFARKHKLVSMIDNTFASPVNFRPAEHGFDLSLHSATKYLNGHSDIVAGAVIGSAALVGKVTKKLNHLGGCLDTHACFLLHRGIKTLAVRMRHQNASTLQIARFLEAHPAVAKVYYPGLESHPRHARAAKLFEGSGGVLSFLPLGGTAAAKTFIARTRLAAHAPSLGGVETLITRPAVSTHGALTAAERERTGVKDELIRLAIGLEHPDDLISDFTNALGSA